MAIKFLRVDGLVLLAGMLLAYGRLDHSWTLFAVAFMAPDLSMLLYFVGARVGGLAYNSMHSYTGPLLLWASFALLGHSWSLPLAMIWAAHIAMDRMFGFGLKHGDDFWDTHLGAITAGRALFEAIRARLSAAN